jgi:hypothetical protein
MTRTRNDRKKVMRVIMQLKAEGRTAVQIAKQLNVQGLRTRFGKEWCDKKVSNFIASNQGIVRARYKRRATTQEVTIERTSSIHESISKILSLGLDDSTTTTVLRAVIGNK